MEDDAALTAAQELARDVFDAPGPEGAAFMPHASVIYGDLADAEKHARTQQARALLLLSAARPSL
jgi:hypothetical protein